MNKFKMLFKISKSNILWHIACIRYQSKSISVSSIICSKSETSTEFQNNKIQIGNSFYKIDKWTNVRSALLSKVGRNIYLQEHHPLSLMKQKIIKFMYSKYINRSGNPLFSVYDRLNPVVTVEQNFDSLLMPNDHPSRNAKETYYINSEYLLRTHTSAHQKDLILTGLNNFLVVGDVYRRDDIDSKHYPVFHQMEAVRLLTSHELFRAKRNSVSLNIFEEGTRSAQKQECHTSEAVLTMEHDLKHCLVELAKSLFKEDIQYRWVDSYFPFTHPSWELEIFHNSKWIEILGCGIMEQNILRSAGAGDKIGWAFGLGLERLAMKLYNIPDIRLFWSNDTGFLSQFKVSSDVPITYKPISIYPQCINDISFWIPDTFDSKDFHELIRNIGGDIIEQVELIDVFFSKKKQRASHCYRIVYRHMEKTLTQEEVNIIHKKIEKNATEILNVEIR